MRYWIKLLNLFCVIINSVAVFLGAYTHNYAMAALSGFFLIVSGTMVLAEEDTHAISNDRE